MPAKRLPPNTRLSRAGLAIGWASLFLSAVPLAVAGEARLVSVQGRQLVRHGRPWHLVGANWAGIAYGQNFGRTAWYPEGNGFSRHPGLAEQEFRLMQQTGIQVVRLGLVDDGRALLDSQGQVAGSLDRFFADVQALLEAAARHQLQVEFVLVDFHIAGAPQMVNGVALRGRRAVIADAARRKEFRQRVLEPFLRQFGRSPALFGIDLINEPEWIIGRAEGGGWEDVATTDPAKAWHPLPREEVTAFANEMAQAIHQIAPGVLVTAGVSAKFINVVAAWPLDYYAVHHAAWMGDLAPWAIRIPTDKPWVLEEYPTRGVPLAPDGYHEHVSRLGGSGASLWNWKPGLDVATADADHHRLCRERLVEWVKQHSEATQGAPP